MKTKLPSFVTILILTLITSLAWIAFSVYRAVTLKPSPAVPQEISEPLNPNLDTQTIELMKSRVFFEESEIPEIKPTK